MMVPGLATIMQEERRKAPPVRRGRVIGPAPWHIGFCIRQETRLGFLHDAWLTCNIRGRVRSCQLWVIIPFRYTLPAEHTAWRHVLKTPPKPL